MRALLWLSILALVASGAFAGCVGRDPEPPLFETDAPAEPPAPPVDDGAGEMGTDVGHMPHMHDYWQQKERVTLMDQQVDIDAFTAMQFTFFDVLTGTPAVGGTFVELPDGAIVYEGTGQLEFTATWSDPAMTAVGLRHKSAGSSEFQPVQPLTSGMPLAIAVTPEMCDMPHEKDSRWAFLLVPPQAGGTMVGALHVKVDIVRMRDITTFPGHPELFGDASTLALYDGPATSRSENFASRLAGFATQSNTDTSVASGKVVPMETLSMTANVTITSATSNVGEVASVDFLYKSAASAFGYERAQVLFADPATGVYQFGWPVEMRETDSPYAKDSQWRFDLLIRSDPTGTGSTAGTGLTDAQVDYTLQVVAYDALLEGIDPKADEDDD